MSWLLFYLCYTIINMKLDPKQFTLSKEEFETMKEILADTQKRRALFAILETELLHLDVEDEDAEQLDRVKKHLDQI